LSDASRQIPGVGVLTALAFMTATEDPARFRKSCSVGAFLGLTPKRHQSGETGWDGRIPKCDDALVRAYLYEVANALLTNYRKWSALKAWGIQLAKRQGLCKAKGGGCAQACRDHASVRRYRKFGQWLKLGSLLRRTDLDDEQTEAVFGGVQGEGYA